MTPYVNTLAEGERHLLSNHADIEATKNNAIEHFLCVESFRDEQKICSRGGYSHTLPIRVCAAQRGRDFEAPDLERGVHFRGVL